MIFLLGSTTLLLASIQTPTHQPLFNPLIWLVLSLILVGILFWSFYKAIKSKNPKYGYLMAIILLILSVLLFI
jgi:hypothetical protein